MQFITIGILSFKDKKYLAQNLKGFQKLEYPHYEILICDNNPDEEIYHWLRQEFPNLTVIRPGKNIGFGGGHNLLIDKAKGEFYLCFNSDMFPEPDFLKELVRCMQKDPKIGAVTGKLLEWRDFPQKPDLAKEHFIDTAGLIIKKSHQVIDRGQSDKDSGQFDQEEEIWGASGAAPLLRIEALKEIAHTPGEYFDKDFFIYKEDVDLSYRLHWAGWKTIYTPKAVAWHDRTTSKPGNIFMAIKKRKERSRLVKEQSFVNQLLLTYKNWSKDYTFKTKLFTTLFLLKYSLYALFFEPYLLRQYQKYFALKPKMTEKRKKMSRKITAQEMERWFTK
jgi:GT2 family glycosyltransferase